MKKIADYIKVRLHVMSPLHIGCDDVYEPTSFVIDEETEKLIEFEPVNFIKALSEDDRRRFSEICMSDNSILEIYKYVRQKYRKDMGGRPVDIADGLVSHYRKVLSMSTFDKKAVINNFTIQRTAYNPRHDTPYVPGSSLKGALRTSYLNTVAQDKGVKQYWETSGHLRKEDLNKPFFAYKQINKRQVSKKLEFDLLGGGFAKDPFSIVKISDFAPLNTVNTKVVYAVNKKKKESDKSSQADNGPKQIFETIQAGSIFEGQINIGIPNEASGIRHPINKESLLLSGHKHYARILKQEIESVHVLGLKHTVGQAINKTFKDNLKKTAFLVRLGRHSGAEAMTIEDNRYIKIMLGRHDSIYLDHATTFWLASDEARPKNNQGLTPFGWAVLEVVQ